MPAVWVKERVVDPAGFEATATKMGESPEIRAFMADVITTQITSRTAGFGAPVVKPFAQRYTQSDAFTQDFVDLAGQQHRWLFEPAPPGVDPAVMHLDVTGMVRRVAAQVNPRLAEAITGPVRVPVSQRDQALEAGRYERPGAQVSRLAYGSLVVAALAALLALLFAHNRSTVLGWLGVGGLLSAAAAWGVGYFFSVRAKDEVAGTEAGVRQVAEVTIDGLVDNLHQWSFVVGGAGAALLLVGLIGRSFARG
nr:hypothetical protein [Gordonia araii]